MTEGGKQLNVEGDLARVLGGHFTSLRLCGGKDLAILASTRAGFETNADSSGSLFAE
jgi:hypothetical protein